MTAWYEKAAVQYEIGRNADAIYSLRQFFSGSPAQDNHYIESARQLLESLEGR